MFSKYLPLLENKRRPHKPVCLIVITDGVPSAYSLLYHYLVARLLLLDAADDPKEVIIEAARRLDHNGVPLNKFGIQFVQIGDDADATAALKELDDGIAGENGIRASLFDYSNCNCGALNFICRTWSIQLPTIPKAGNSQSRVSSRSSWARSINWLMN